MTLENIRNKDVIIIIWYENGEWVLLPVAVWVVLMKSYPILIYLKESKSSRGK